MKQLSKPRMYTRGLFLKLRSVRPRLMLKVQAALQWHITVMVV